jgi:hypothetical protein
VGPHLDADPMQDLYSWPAHPVAAMTAAFLQAHVQTGEAVFLEPLLQMGEMRRAYLAAGNPDGAIGSAAWAAHRLPMIINGALAKWRQLTGNSRFDDLLLADAGGYVRFLLANDHSALARELSATARTLSVNWPMFTTEVRYTDRVLSFPHAWPATIATGLARINADLIYSSVTGDPGSVQNFPLNGARWHTLPRGIAVLVSENRRERFSAELFHFGATRRAMAVSLLTLAPGNYTWRLVTTAGRELSRGNRSISTANRRLPFTLPPGVSCQLTVEVLP